MIPSGIELLVGSLALLATGTFAFIVGYGMGYGAGVSRGRTEILEKEFIYEPPEDIDD